MNPVGILPRRWKNIKETQTALGRDLMRFRKKGDQVISMVGGPEEAGGFTETSTNEENSTTET